MRVRYTAEFRLPDGITFQRGSAGKDDMRTFCNQLNTAISPYSKDGSLQYRFGHGMQRPYRYVAEFDLLNVSQGDCNDMASVALEDTAKHLNSAIASYTEGHTLQYAISQIADLPIDGATVDTPEKTATHRANLHTGMVVDIVLKKDQPTGKLTRGTISRILTNSADHHRGIKVMLMDGQVGRVQKIISDRGES